MTIEEPGTGRYSIWVRPTSMADHVHECCDCGTTHRYQYRVAIDAQGVAWPEYRVKRIPNHSVARRRRK